jgi:hypothetical protein
MDANMWQIISIIGFSLSGVLFIVAMFMFIKMNIPAIIGDLTGRTAAKQIKAIREKNTNTGEKRYKPDVFNVERGKLTELMANRAKKTGKTGQTSLESKRLDLERKTAETAQMKEYQSSVIEETAVASESTYLLSDGTKVLSDETHVLSNDTELLTENKEENLLTEVLSDSTEVLLEDPSVSLEPEGTTVLGSTEELTSNQEPVAQSFEFKIVKDIKVIHTKERI